MMEAWNCAGTRRQKTGPPKFSLAGKAEPFPRRSMPPRFPPVSWNLALAAPKSHMSMSSPCHRRHSRPPRRPRRSARAEAPLAGPVLQEPGSERGWICHSGGIHRRPKEPQRAGPDKTLSTARFKRRRQAAARRIEKTNQMTKQEDN